MTKQKSDRKEVEGSTCKVGEIVLPGQIVDAAGVKEASKKNQVIVGPGLRKFGDRIVASKCGVLREMNGKIYWVDALEKRYLPASREGVVGVVIKKMGDFYKVDVRAADAALLHFLAFEGATKKNRPEINVGDVVYGRMVVVSPDMEPELVCINEEGKRTWASCQADSSSELAYTW
uniref:Exosome complex component RRP40 n=1 Tax=Lygus hesperus TaxID=30085 RepID=A0A0A9VY86_LYGHE